MAYWMPTIGMLRYAILPISLLVVLLAGKAMAFYDMLDGRLLRASVAGAFAFALLFAVLGIAIIEVNAPMFVLFARRIGPDQYLDQRFERTNPLPGSMRLIRCRTSMALTIVREHYAPDPAKFYCSFGPWDEAEPALARCRCEYVVLPGERKPGRDAEPVFSDANFTVWQLR